MKRFYFVLLILFSSNAFAQKNALRAEVAKKAASIEQKVIAWRRDFHEHPELGNEEVRTSEVITKHLQSLGMIVTAGVARTGVVGILNGGKPGPVVALRAEMDGLPVTERVKIPFASKVKTTYNGQETGIMHACGHDSHMAILMGVAEVLASMKKDIPGTIKFIFQPAEEGVMSGELSGAELMVKEGVLKNPAVDVIFGLHINSQTPVGNISYRPGGIMAAVNDMKITVMGKQAHGAYPWSSIDPVVISAQIVNNLQTIVSRNLDVTANAGVVTIGSIQGGIRSNIIPEKVEMLGTVRNLSKEDEAMFIERIKTIVTKTAEAGGGTAEVKIPFSYHYPVTYNDPALTAKMLPSLKASAGADHVKLKPAVTGGEDFSFFQEKVPGLFIFLGGMPKGQDPLKAPSHHTPDFFIDESGFVLGVNALSNLALDYMAMKK
jgi:amidohydrolase